MPTTGDTPCRVCGREARRHSLRRRPSDSLSCGLGQWPPKRPLAGARQRARSCKRAGLSGPARGAAGCPLTARNPFRRVSTPKRRWHGPQGLCGCGTGAVWRETTSRLAVGPNTSGGGLTAGLGGHASARHRNTRTTSHIPHTSTALAKAAWWVPLVSAARPAKPSVSLRRRGVAGPWPDDDAPAATTGTPLPTFQTGFERGGRQM